MGGALKLFFTKVFHEHHCTSSFNDIKLGLRSTDGKTYEFHSLQSFQQIMLKFDMILQIFRQKRLQTFIFIQVKWLVLYFFFFYRTLLWNKNPWQSCFWTFMNGLQLYLAYFKISRNVEGDSIHYGCSALYDVLTDVKPAEFVFCTVSVRMQLILFVVITVDFGSMILWSDGNCSVVVNIKGLFWCLLC